jgi:methyltransferase (TIGR00027 family)
VRDEKPSATAWRVALARAAHQIFDTPKVFDDPLALRIVGAYAQGTSPERFFHDRYKFTRRARFVRALLVIRSRVAEEELAAAVQRGVRQYVLLGAGLDTFAYRNPHGGVRVFEVDHPATQAWKRTILRRAGIPEPDSLTFVPVNFESQTALEGLLAAGLDRSSPALFAWLGVTMYLQEDAVYAVLRDIAGMPSGSGIIFDYAVSKSEMSLLGRLMVAVVNRRLKRISEPWVTFLSPEALAAKLRSLGFHEIRDLGSDELNARYLSGRTDSLRVGPVGRLMIGSV